MRVLTIDDIVKEYHEQLGDESPGQAALLDICKSPFWFIHKQMKRPDLPTIRVKYFGEFKVFQSGIKKKMKKLEDDLKFKSITEEQYNEKKQILINRLKEIIIDEEQILQIDEG